MKKYKFIEEISLKDNMNPDCYNGARKALYDCYERLKDLYKTFDKGDYFNEK